MKKARHKALISAFGLFSILATSFPVAGQVQTNADISAVSKTGEENKMPLSGAENERVIVETNFELIEIEDCGNANTPPETAGNFPQYALFGLPLGLLLAASFTNSSDTEGLTTPVRGSVISASSINQ